MKYQKPLYPYNYYIDEIHHYYDGEIVKIEHQPPIRNECPLQVIQKMTNSQVKGIYAGFVMVEAKCIEVDKEQVSQTEWEYAPRASNTQNTQNLIALQDTLLHEHHDFFLASQHP
jgi:hypothetical protein